MKKLFFTAVAVLAFSGSGFAEGKVDKEIKSKSGTTACRAAGNAASAWGIANNLTPSQISSLIWETVTACNKAANNAQ